MDWTLDDQTDDAVTVTDDRTDPATALELGEVTIDPEAANDVYDEVTVGCVANWRWASTRPSRVGRNRGEQGGQGHRHAGRGVPRTLGTAM